MSPQQHIPPTNTRETTAGVLEFTVDRPGQPRRRLRLSGQSYTFGSGDGCSVRLEDASVRDMHAILIRQQDRVLVRGYGIALLINGQGTAEAWLEQGDRFELGEFTFTLSEGAGTFAPEPAADASHTSPQEPPGEFGVPNSPLGQGYQTPGFTNPEALTGLEFGQRSAGPRRLSFSDGMRLVTRGSSEYVPSAPSQFRSPPKRSRSKSSRPDTTRLRRIEEAQRESIERADAAFETSLASTSAVEKLANRMDSLFNHLEDLTSQQRQAESRETQLVREEMEATAKKNAEQEVAFGQLNERLNVLQTAVDQATREAREYREKHEQALSRIEQLETQLQTAVETHDQRQAQWETETRELRGAIDGLTSKLQIAKDENAEAKLQIASLEKQLHEAIESHQAHRESWALEAKELHETIDQLSSQLAASQSRADEVQAELDAAESNRAELQGKLEESELVSEQLKSQLAVSESSAIETQSQLAQSASGNSDLQDQLEASETRSAQLQSQLSSSESLTSELQAKLQASESSVTQLQRQLEENEQQSSANAVTADEVVRLHAQLGEAQARLDSLKSQQRDRMGEWQREREELEFKIANQSSELSQIEALRLSAENHVEDNSVADRLASRLEAEVSRLQKEQHVDPLESFDVNGDTISSSQLASAFDNVETDTAPEPPEPQQTQELTDYAFGGDASGNSFEQASNEGEGSAPSAGAFGVAEPSFDSSHTFDEPNEFAHSESEENTADAIAEGNDPHSAESSAAFQDVEEPAPTESDEIGATVVGSPQTIMDSFSSVPDASAFAEEEDDEPENVVEMASDASEFDASGFGYEEEDGSDSTAAHDSTMQMTPELMSSFGVDDGSDEYQETSESQDIGFDGENVYESITSPEESADHRSLLQEVELDQQPTEEYSDSADDVGNFGATETLANDFTTPAEPEQESFHGGESLDEANDPLAEFGGVNAESIDYTPEAEAAEIETTENIRHGLDTEAYSGLAASIIDEIGNDEPNVDPGVSLPFNMDPDNLPSEPVQSSEEAPEESYYGGDQLADAEPEAVPEPEPEPEPEPATPEPEPHPSGLATAHLYDGFEDEEVTPAPAPAPVQTAPAPTPVASEAVSEPASDDSIEAYMDRLLQRMHSDSPGGQSAPAQESVAAQPVVPETPPEPEPIEDTSTLEESEYVPRRSAPEGTDNLAQMRELANNSARQAIATSVRSRQRSKGFLKVAFSVMSIMGAGVFAVLSMKALFPHALACIACIVLAVFFGMGGLKLLSQNSSSSTDRAPAPNDPNAEFDGQEPPAEV